MPKFVRVRVKETGAHIWIDEINVNNSVEVLKRQPSRGAGDLSPTPKKQVASATKSGASTSEDSTPKSTASRGRKNAGDSGTEKEGSK